MTFKVETTFTNENGTIVCRSSIGSVLIKMVSPKEVLENEITTLEAKKLSDLLIALGFEEMSGLVFGYGARR